MILDQRETGVVIVEEKPLTREESSRLAVLEKAIQDNFLGFVIVGNALAEINEKRLYRTKEGRTFETYCRELWDMSGRRAYQLIGSASAVENVNNCSHFESQDIEFIAPQNEAQARELAGLRPDDQIAVWRSVLEKASATKEKITAGKIKKTVAEFKGEKLTRAIKQATAPEDTAETEEKKPLVSEAFENAWAVLWEQVEKERRANWRYTSKAVVYERTLLLLEAFCETGVQSPQKAKGQK